MKEAELQATPFRGDPDVEALHAFFQPERQFAGHTRWSFGKSLKSAYVNSFEFLNNAPLVQLWRDSDAQLQAVSCIALADGTWFYQAAPEHRMAPIARMILEQADRALQLLSAQASWTTVAYESDRAADQLLGDHGYEKEGGHHVFMTRSLADPIHPSPSPAGCSLRELDPSDPDQVFERGDAQTDAFLEGQPYAEVAAWMTRTIPWQLSYGRPRQHPSVIAVQEDGKVLAFADYFLDHENKIGEFEPVGTRKDAHRRGIAKAALTRALKGMQKAGMTQAVVRTGCENSAAIAAYSSVGFAISDRLMVYRKHRDL